MHLETLPIGTKFIGIKLLKLDYEMCEDWMSYIPNGHFI